LDFGAVLRKAVRLASSRERSDHDRGDGRCRPFVSASLRRLGEHLERVMRRADPSRVSATNAIIR
jgi:hypothetical protein